MLNKYTAERDLKLQIIHLIKQHLQSDVRSIPSTVVGENSEKFKIAQKREQFCIANCCQKSSHSP